jgi:hypothetical protein
MKKSSLLFLLAAVMFGCNDAGLVPPEKERVPPPHDVVIAIGVIPGIYTSFRCVDSLGRSKTTFGPSEPIFLRYSVINQTGKDQTWATGMSYPFARFFVMHGEDTLADSFAGFAFLTVPSKGTLKNGDSLTSGWNIDPAKISLPPGPYLTTASPRFVLVDLGVPGDSWKVFDVTR